MFHYQTEPELAIDQYPAPDYPGTPECCGREMLLFSIDEWHGDGELSFLCPECGAWVVK